MQEISRSLPLAIAILGEHAKMQLRENLPKTILRERSILFSSFTALSKDVPSTDYNIQILSCILIKKQLFILCDL